MRYLIALAILTLLVVAKIELKEEERFYDQLRTIEVVPPKGKPTPSESAIELATLIYNIEVPPNVSLEYDPDLEPRGLAMLRSTTRRVHVKIGPSAFTSWGLLGSTLAHEVEIHANQNLYLVEITGSAHAEREAYRHELENADRFHLTDKEVKMIRKTMNHYYPVEKQLTRE